MRTPHKSLPRKSNAHTKATKLSAEDKDLLHLRTLAHDLSNALEAILQASYLLNQASIEGNARRWVQLIDTSSQDAARINREIRKRLRALCDDE